MCARGGREGGREIARLPRARVHVCVCARPRAFAIGYACLRARALFVRVWVCVCVCGRVCNLVVFHGKDGLHCCLVVILVLLHGSRSLRRRRAIGENFQIDKSTIELEVETLRSPFLDVRRTGAQLLAGSFKNKAAQNALTECNVVSILIDLLRQSSDDEFDRCLTVALRNALGAFNRDICRHPDALVCLVSKLDGCMNQDASTKVEVGRNCARVLIALASDEESKELIRGNRGGDVAKKISNDSRNNAHLISLSRTLCTALTASSF